MSSIAEAFGYKTDEKLYRTTPLLVSSDHGIGVEVEIENVVYDYQRDSPDKPVNSRLRGVDSSSFELLPDLSKYWLVIKDGSLRKGTEFIFREPYKGANITEALNVMNNFLRVHRRSGLPPVASDRCSIHVHLDARDMDEYQLNNILLIYILVERVMFHYVNPTRAKNNYCRPLSDSAFTYVLNDLKKVAASKMISDLPNIISNSCDKYSALNLRPLIKFGSIEFRHHQGTTDMDAVKDWINIILTLKCAALHSDIKEILGIYEKDPMDVLLKVFAGTVLSTNEFIKSFDWQLELARGYNDIKEILDFDVLSQASRKKTPKRKPGEKALIAMYIEKNGIVVPTAAKTSKPNREDTLLSERDATVRTGMDNGNDGRLQVNPIPSARATNGRDGIRYSDYAINMMSAAGTPSISSDAYIRSVNAFSTSIQRERERMLSEAGIGANPGNSEPLPAILTLPETAFATLPLVVRNHIRFLRNTLIMVENPIRPETPSVPEPYRGVVYNEPIEDNAQDQNPEEPEMPRPVIEAFEGAITRANAATPSTATTRITSN